MSCTLALILATGLAAGATVGAVAAPVDCSGPTPPPQTPATTPFLGIEMSPVPHQVQTTLGIDARIGVYVQSTFPNTAAAGMGLRPGDVITRINGSDISSMTAMRMEIGSTKVGEPVDLVVRRGDQELVLGDTIKPWPADIPFVPIDAAAEERYRKYQEQRQSQQNRQLDDVRKDADVLNQKLSSLLDDADLLGGSRADDTAGPAAGSVLAPGSAKPGDPSAAQQAARRDAFSLVVDLSTARTPAAPGRPFAVGDLLGLGDDGALPILAAGPAWFLRLSFASL